MKALSLKTSQLLDSKIEPFINGQKIKTQNQIKLVNPANNKIFANVGECDESHVDHAVNAAKNSFQEYSCLKPSHRSKILLALANLIEESATYLAEVDTLCMGKPFNFNRLGEVPFCANTFRYYAGLCDYVSGVNQQSLSFPVGDLRGYTRKEPIGVVGAIIPFNGPLTIASWKIAPALAVGCSLVVKPAQNTPISMIILAELAQQAGLPDGVLNVVLGKGQTIGQQLGLHSDIDKLAFTGSTSIGRSLVHAAASSNLKKLSLELGGKSPFIVFEDCHLAKAVDGAIDAVFANSGQVCVAGSRMYIQESIFDEFLDALTQKTKNLKVGDPFDDETFMGPLASKNHLQDVHIKVQKAIQNGATLVTGGSLLNQEGYFYPPTILTNVTNQDEIVKEELFAPVACVMKFKNVDEVIQLANDSPYGLASSIWSNNYSLIHRMSEKLQAGIVWINTHNIPDLSMPIGGYKQSGWSKELGVEGLNEYLKTKSIIARLD